MSKTNTNTVHRSNLLMGHPWGQDLRYDELVMVEEPPKDGEVAMLGFKVNPALKPGEGPSRDEREAGFYHVLYIAEATDGRTVRIAVNGIGQQDRRSVEGGEHLHALHELISLWGGWPPVRA